MWRYVSSCVKSFRCGVPVAPRCGRAVAASRDSTASSSGGDESRRRADGRECDWRARHLYDSWLSAFTWSGALVLGWYASQIACLQRRRPHLVPSQRNGNVFDSHLALVRPVVRAFDVDERAAVRQTSPPPLPPRLNVFNVSDDRRSDESSFEEALRSIENKLGVAAIGDGNADEGFAMIEASARKSYTPALFNLAVCYEKGLGVEPNEKMAMELYRSAASRSHPGAMYNLAVFYGQGRGGLAPDPQAARDLIRVAAAQGQKEAIAALELLARRAADSTAATSPAAPPEKSLASFVASLGREGSAVLNQAKSILTF